MLITRSPVSRTHANAYWFRWKKAQLPGSPMMQWYLRRESLHFNWSRCGDSESWARHARLEVWSGCRFARIDLIFEVMGPIAYPSYTYLRPSKFFSSTLRHSFLTILFKYILVLLARGKWMTIRALPVIRWVSFFYPCASLAAWASWTTSFQNVWMV